MQALFNYGRGTYDTTGVMKPPEPVGPVRPPLPSTPPVTTPSSPSPNEQWSRLTFKLAARTGRRQSERTLPQARAKPRNSSQASTDSTGGSHPSCCRCRRLSARTILQSVPVRHTALARDTDSLTTTPHPASALVCAMGYRCPVQSYANANAARTAKSTKAGHWVLDARAPQPDTDADIIW